MAEKTEVVIYYKNTEQYEIYRFGNNEENILFICNNDYHEMHADEK